MVDGGVMEEGVVVDVSGPVAGVPGQNWDNVAFVSSEGIERNLFILYT